MKNVIICLLSFILICGCHPTSKIGYSSIKNIRYSRQVKLDHPILVKPHTLPSAGGGDTSDHPCLRGEYSHIYEATGLHAGEVWLCCVPINDLLTDNFNCGDVLLIPGYGDEEYMKITSCHLLHPTSPTPVYVPVCISAPLTAPIDRIVRGDK